MWPPPDDGGAGTRDGDPDPTAALRRPGRARPPLDRICPSRPRPPVKPAGVGQPVPQTRSCVYQPVYQVAADHYPRRPRAYRPFHDVGRGNTGSGIRRMRVHSITVVSRRSPHRSPGDGLAIACPSFDGPANSTTARSRARPPRSPQPQTTPKTMPCTSSATSRFTGPRPGGRLHKPRSTAPVDRGLVRTPLTCSPVCCSIRCERPDAHPGPAEGYDGSTPGKVHTEHHGPVPVRTGRHHPRQAIARGDRVANRPAHTAAAAPTAPRYAPCSWPTAASSRSP
jgi:hypothetical protein